MVGEEPVLNSHSADLDEVHPTDNSRHLRTITNVGQEITAQQLCHLTIQAYRLTFQLPPSCPYCRAVYKYSLKRKYRFPVFPIWIICIPPLLYDQLGLRPDLHLACGAVPACPGNCRPWRRRTCVALLGRLLKGAFMATIISLSQPIESGSTVRYPDNAALSGTDWTGTWDLGRTGSPRFSFLRFLPDEIHPLLSPLLEAQGTSFPQWLSALDVSIAHDGIEPWCVILFDRLLPLQDHAVERRKHPLDYRGITYLMAREWMPEVLPPLGGFIAIVKETMRPEAPDEEPFTTVWKSIKDLSPDRRWLCLVRAPDRLGTVYPRLHWNGLV